MRLTPIFKVCGKAQGNCINDTESSGMQQAMIYDNKSTIVLVMHVRRIRLPIVMVVGRTIAIAVVTLVVIFSHQLRSCNNQ